MKEENDKLRKLKEKDLKVLEFNLQKVNEEIEDVLRTLGALKPAREKVLALQSSIPEIKKAVDSARSRIKEEEENQATLKKQLEIHEAERILRSISEDYENYEKSQRIAEELEPEAKRYERLLDEQERLNTDIAKERRKIERDIEFLESEVTKLEERVKKEKQQTAKLGCLPSASL